MSKQSGMGFAVAVDDSTGTLRTISNDVTNLAYSTPRGVQDVTGVDKFAIERLLLLADMSVTLNGVHNNAATFSHAVFRTVPSTSVNRTTTLTISSQVLTGELLYSDYATTRGQDGSLTWSAPGVLADGQIPTWA
jgi:hypothetical protein